MLQNVIQWAAGDTTVSTVISKETLNHQGLIEMVTGLDVYQHTPEAYRRAYQALGIDIINRVPLDSAPAPTAPGEIRNHSTQPYHFAPLGVYDTVLRHTYPCENPEDVWALDIASLHYEDLLTLAPHPCTQRDIQMRERYIGEVGLYYPMLYTTLFMWGVEVLGWEIFLLAAALEPDRFHEAFLKPCVSKAAAIVTEIAAASESPFVFVHDDLADARGPVFRPAWYERYIFPHYATLFAGAKERGKKIIFVADGNMREFLPKLREVGVDGLMFESPATLLDAIIEYFGDQGCFFIGGIDTKILTFGTPEAIRHMVFDLVDRAACYPGFAMASGGGLHNNIPIENLIAYFDARVEVGATSKNWKTLWQEA